MEVKLYALMICVLRCWIFPIFLCSVPCFVSTQEAVAGTLLTAAEKAFLIGQDPAERESARQKRIIELTSDLLLEAKVLEMFKPVVDVNRGLGDQFWGDWLKVCEPVGNALSAAYAYDKEIFPNFSSLTQRKIDASVSDMPIKTTGNYVRTAAHMLSMECDLNWISKNKDYAFRSVRQLEAFYNWLLYVQGEQKKLLLRLTSGDIID